MAKEQKKELFVVKKEIEHQGILYSPGQKVELTLNHALVHGTRIEPFSEVATEQFSQISPVKEKPEEKKSLEKS